MAPADRVEPRLHLRDRLADVAARPVCFVVIIVQRQIPRARLARAQRGEHVFEVCELQGGARGLVPRQPQSGFIFNSQTAILPVILLGE